MRHAQHGKLDAKMWTALIFGVAFFGFLFFATRPHVYRPDWNALQKAQLNALNAAAEPFANEFDGYPPSDPNDPAGRPYCGAMKLTEALMGQDLLGFHSSSIFRRDGLDAEGTLLYPANIDDLPNALRENSLKARKGPFLQAENANAWRLADVYGKGNTGPLVETTFVLCDIYTRVRPGGEKTGMPILFYRADPSRPAHDVLNPDNPQNTYCYRDNQALIALGVPGQPGQAHALADPKRFYLNTQDYRTPSRPARDRRDSFILISAGADGLYGTADDICNFEWKYRQH